MAPVENVTGVNQRATASVLASVPPDAQHRWKADEGTGSTVADSIGSEDGSIDGATWESVSDAQGGYELSHDGTDDNVVNNNSFAGVSASSDFATGLTINPDDMSSDQAIYNLGNPNNSDSRAWMWVDGSNSYIGAAYYDGSNYVDTASDGGHISANTRYRVLINYELSADTIRIYVDTVNKTSGGNQNGNVTTSGSEFVLGSHATDGKYWQGDWDDFIFYDDILSTGEIDDDYKIQPWA